MMKQWTWPCTFLLWLVVVSGQLSAFAESSPETELPPVGTVVPDVICGRVDALALTYDLLVPVAKPNGATVIFVVSGGWNSVWFPPEMAMVPEWNGMSLLHDLLTDGYHVAIVRHGSAPRFKVPDAASHVRKALQHLREKAPERGLDPERIGSFGFSAGGHLSLYLAMLGGEEATPNSVPPGRIRMRRRRSRRRSPRWWPGIRRWTWFGSWVPATPSRPSTSTRNSRTRFLRFGMSMQAMRRC